MQKVILITGASRGIGAETARLAAKQDYHVVINHRDSEAEAQALATELSQHASTTVLQADISIESDVIRMFTELEKNLGSVDVLVNNAGFTGPAGRRLQDTSAELLQKVMGVNVIGTMLCAREAIRRMVKGKGGHIINVSSTATRQGSPNDWLDYAAAKGAVDIFTQGLAREVAADSIRVNSIAPGLTATEIHERAGAPDRLDRLAASVPMGRAARAEEIAQCILWLATESPEYLTGAIIPVSGGR